MQSACAQSRHSINATVIMSYYYFPALEKTCQKGGGQAGLLAAGLVLLFL